MTQQPVRRTKIVCTLGPAVDSDEAVRELLLAGMNVARLNFSHGTHPEHRMRLERVRRIAAELSVPVALLLDTKGPEIRTGLLLDNAEIELESGDQIVLTTDEVTGTRERVGISYAHLPQEVKPGDHIYVADGIIDLEVTAVAGADVRCRVVSGGTLGNRKNVNIPTVKVQLPAVTEKDRADIEFAVREEMDFIAASFVRRPSDVEEIRSILRASESQIRIIAKIESREGLENIDEIIRVSDGVMVARGDLGVQLAIHEIPLAQKRIIDKCNAANKPVVTATQMLDSMIENPRPTRAELTDVANAIFDGTDAVMLSGETASGRYPVKACRTLHDIAVAVESSDEYRRHCLASVDLASESLDVGQALAKATFLIARDLDAAAIIAPHAGGNTPRLLSMYRPAQSIVAVATSAAVQRSLLIYWGIVPLVAAVVEDSETMVQNAIREALDKGLVGPTDRVVTTAGIPLHSAIPMNTIKVHFLGHILNRGQTGFGPRVTARVVRAVDAAHARRRLRLDRSEALLTRMLDEESLPLVSGLAAVILEDRSTVSHERIREANPGVSFVSRVPAALSTIEDGITVTVDGDEKIIYEGVV